MIHWAITHKDDTIPAVTKWASEATKTLRDEGLGHPMVSFAKDGTTALSWITDENRLREIKRKYRLKTDQIVDGVHFLVSENN